MQVHCAVALPRPSACCPSCWRRRPRPIRVRGPGTDAQLAAVRRARPTSRARPRGCRSTTTARRARASSSSWRSRPRPPGSGSARCSSTSAAPAARRRTPSRRRAPTRSRRSTSTSTSSGWIRGASGRASRRSTARPTRRPTGIYSQPFTTPDNLNPRALVTKDLRYIARCAALNRQILPHVSTANVARDIDLLRQALGGSKITYFGYSYGTFLGSTYASLFPHNYRAMVLDGPVDADSYINDPLATLSAQSGGFERALGHFFEACAADVAACRGFGNGDPRDEFDQLVEQLDAQADPGRRGRPPARRRRRRARGRGGRRLQQGQLAVPGPGAGGRVQRRRNAAAHPRRTPSTAATTTARSIPSAIATSPSARPSSTIRATSGST